MLLKNSYASSFLLMSALQKHKLMAVSAFLCPDFYIKTTLQLVLINKARTN